MRLGERMVGDCFQLPTSTLANTASPPVSDRIEVVWGLPAAPGASGASARRVGCLDSQDKRWMEKATVLEYGTTKVFNFGLH